MAKNSFFGFLASIKIAFIIIFVLSNVLGAEGSTKNVIVSTQDDLPGMVESAVSGTIFLLKDGIYKLNRPIIVGNPGVSIQSESGDRNKVILDGNMGTGELKRENCVNEIISVKASDVVIQDISICHARDHGLHISPKHEGNIRNVIIRNIHLYDCGQQLIKVNSNGGDPLFWTEDSVLEDSLIEFIDSSIMHDMGTHFYTGGIDVHGGKNWHIRRNVFRNIQREGKMMEHAIHMWSRSRGTIVEQNTFIDCYRAIGFGMKREASGLTRNYSDGKGHDPYFDHVEGIIRNNFIFNRKGIHLETGIELMNVIDVKVHHNTVVSQDEPFSSIEYRWPNTRVEIINNIVSQTIMERNNAKAHLMSNIENADINIFNGYESGDLHLISTAEQAIGNGMKIKETSYDIDNELRDANPDIGADEYLHP